jgi:hypothetical protein
VTLEKSLMIKKKNELSNSLDYLFYELRVKKKDYFGYEKITVSKVVFTQKSRCSIIPNKKSITNVDRKYVFNSQDMRKAPKIVPTISTIANPPTL